MGWTYYNVPVEYRNGKSYIDRKSECDRLFNWNKEHKGGKVLKSAMVGSTYYAAVQLFEGDIPTDVVAVVVLTRTDCKSHYNFGYKDMDETMGPYCYSCPESILKLLTPTTNEDALSWRENCKKYRFAQARKSSLRSLPIGTKIRFNSEYTMTGGTQRGDEVTLTKVERGDGTTIWWGQGYRWSPKYINSNYKVVEDSVS